MNITKLPPFVYEDDDQPSDEPTEPDYSPSYDDQARDRLRGCDGYDKGDWRRGGV